MAEEILRMFVYISGLVLIVSIIHSAIALIQLMKDAPPIRKKIWIWHNR